VDKQEFLERLTNPTKFWIEERIAEFNNSASYYAWDIVNVRTWEKNGSHDIIVQTSRLEYLNELNKTIISLFPPSENYKLVGAGTSTNFSGKGNPGDIYEQRFAVVEARCYD